VGALWWCVQALHVLDMLKSTGAHPDTIIYTNLITSAPTTSIGPYCAFGAEPAWYMLYYCVQLVRVGVCQKAVGGCLVSLQSTDYFLSGQLDTDRHAVCWISCSVPLCFQSATAVRPRARAVPLG